MKTSLILSPWLCIPLLAIAAYLAFCLVVALRQRRLLYFPQRLTAAEADAEFASYGVRRWPPDSAGGYLAVVKPTPADASLTNGTVLVFHGNGGGAHEREFYCDTLQRLGWRVILAEYPGYGARPGTWSEASFREDGRRTARQVRQAYPGPLVLLGESLGCGVAAAVAADPAVAPDALILATPWDRLATVASHYYPWLPVRILLRDRYDTVAYLKDYAGTVSIILAEEDETLPPASTLALYEALPHPDRKLLLRIPQAGHNTWFWLVSDAQWRDLLLPAQSRMTNSLPMPRHSPLKM